MRALIKAGRNALRRAGFDIVRHYHVPSRTLLGLTHFPIRTVIDVGANIGQSTLQYLALFPEATVHAFEPLPDVFCELQRAVKPYAERVCAYNVALGAVEATSEMFRHCDHNASSSLLATTDRTAALYPQVKSQARVHVQQRRLDAVLEAITLQQGIFIKIDAQGYEKHVLSGGMQVLERSSACLIEVAVQELYEGQASFHELVELFWGLEFVFAGTLEQHYDEQGRVVYFDAMFVKKQWAGEKA